MAPARCRGFCLFLVLVEAAGGLSAVPGIWARRLEFASTAMGLTVHLQV